MATNMNILTAVLLAAVLTLLTTSDAGNVGDSCQTPNSTVGTCISLHGCPFIQDLVKLPKKPTWVKTYLRKCQCRTFVGDTPVVCCPDPDASAVHRHLHLINRDGCGFSSVDRIIGGNESRLAEFPWMAVLNYKVNDTFQDQCAGSLITDQFVLTAAHCINRHLKHVRLGEHDIRTDPDCELLDDGDEDCSDPVQKFTVKGSWVHPRYSRRTYVNDIGLIQLNTPATINEYVKPICLPVEETNLLGKNVTVAGWGVTEQNVPSPVLLYTHIPIMSRKQCRATFARFGVKLVLSDNQICGGGGGDFDSCSGDSGGPMTGFPEGSDKYMQYGIVSYGAKQCATLGMPAVYTDVSKYINWILDTIKP